MIMAQIHAAPPPPGKVTQASPKDSPDRFWYMYEEDGPPYYQNTTIIVTQEGTRGAQIEAMHQWYPPGPPPANKPDVWWPPSSSVLTWWPREKARAFHQALIRAGVFSLTLFRHNKSDKLHVKLEMTFGGKYFWTAFNGGDSQSALAFHKKVLELVKKFGLRDGEQLHTRKNSQRVIVH